MSVINKTGAFFCIFFFIWTVTGQSNPSDSKSDEPTKSFNTEFERLAQKENKRVIQKIFESPIPVKELEFLPNLGVPSPFFAGERFLFSVSWLTIDAGYAEIKIEGIKPYGDTEAYHLVAKAWTNSFFSKFFTVTDRIESWLDTSTFLSLRYEEHIREGSYSRDKIFELFHDQRIATQEEKKYSISRKTQDPFSCLMVLRILKYKPGEKFTIDVFANRKCYQIIMEVGPVKELTTKAGNFQCFSVEPTLRLRGRVLEENSKLKMWFTNDERRIPVRLETKVKIGTIIADLIEYSSPQDKEEQ